MSETWYVVPDLDNFTDKARAIVYNNFGVWNNPDNLDILIDDVVENEQEEFDKVLSHQESLVIVTELVKKQKNRKTKEIRYTINDNIFADIVHRLNDRMVSNIINSLVQKGLVETAFDDESNDFIFWVKNDENEKEKPETD
jgi:hypothetical protein